MSSGLWTSIFRMRFGSIVWELEFGQVVGAVCCLMFIVPIR